MSIHYYFKLFYSIKEEHEVDFAELELGSLFGEVKKIRNVTDILNKNPFNNFINEEIRLQDILTYELPYGKFQGFYGIKDELENISDLVKRLAYIPEFYQVFKSKEEPKVLLRKIFPAGVLNKNVQFFRSGETVLFRFITHQYFLEKSYYISRLSRNDKEVDINVDTLFNFPTSSLYRIPASATTSVGKRLEDYFAIREEPSLHLTHYMHPYKGRFHPKMVRALLNYVYPKNQGLVMDNFAGCGTLLVEATWLELDSIGVEINPLSVLMSNVKCNSLALEPSLLKEHVKSFLDEVKNAISRFNRQSDIFLESATPQYNLENIIEQKSRIPDNVVQMFRNENDIEKTLITNEILKSVIHDQIRNFILLGLSGTISDLTRRRSADFVEVLEERLMDLYQRIYIFKKLNETLKIQLGVSETLICDTRDMKNTCRKWNGEVSEIKDNSINAIINSPPYSTALDYIKNDLPQLTLLNIAPSIEQLQVDMIGNPKSKYYTDELIQEIESNHEDFIKLPNIAKDIIQKLLRGDRKKTGLRTYKFFKDIYLSLKEMCRVMKKGAKCAIIIGNNNYKISQTWIEVKNDQVIGDIAENTDIGLFRDKTITREIEKTRAGMIRYESIVILEKK
jgi:tRNA G10  N-methylase Trm11